MYADNTNSDAKTRRDDAYEAVSRLEPMERKVLELLVDGCSLVQVAGNLAIDLEKAVLLKAALMRKLEASSTADLVRIGILAQALEPAPANRRHTPS